MIFLIRHCTPKINYNKCDYLEAKSRMNEYNVTLNIALEEIIPFENCIAKLLEQEKSMVIYSSPSPRALLTAKNMFSAEDKIIISENFKEFDLDIVPIPFLKFEFRTWLFISRILWFFGILKTNKSFSQERQRAFECAEILAAKAQDNIVILVAHGLLNMFTERKLKQMGYARTNKVKNGCFAISKLEKYN